MKQAYYKSYDGWGWEWVKGEATGKCNSVTGGPQGRQDYIQFRRKILGIPLYCVWINVDNVKYFDPVEETVYQCNCSNCKDNP